MSTTTAQDPERRPSNPALWDDIAALLDQSFGGETSTGEKKTLSKGVELRLRKLRKEGQARWRKLVTGDENKRIRDHFGGEVDRLRQKSRARARELVTGDATVAIEDHLKTQPVVKLIDKLSFTLGLFGLGITEFIVLKQPQLYWLWFSAVMVLLLTLRIFSYVEKRWGFFMIDFCYFAVVMNMVWTVFYSDNYVFGQMNFMFCNGPMLVATLAWRNSLVFHSLDKMTSIFIHFLGALLTFLARWHPQGRNIICEERAISPTNIIMEGRAASGGQEVSGVEAECAALSLMSALVVPVAGYFIWQILQIIIMEGIFGSMITNDPTLQTSIRWLCKDYKNGMHQLAKSVCRSTGIFASDETLNGEEWKSKIIFWISQLLYTIVTLIPGIIVWHNYWLHVAWLVYVMWSCTWNGASFYIEVFASRYALQFSVDERSGGGSGGALSGFQDPDALPTPLPQESPGSITEKKKEKKKL